MYSIDTVLPDFEPRRVISSQLPELEKLVKMYEQDSAFVCGLLAEYKPGKIVEVGIANGGTSAIIMQCMKMHDLTYELHCVDKLRKGYGGYDRNIGFLGKEASRLLLFENYNLWDGVILPQIIDQIGDHIDFLILDTIHKLPGETLDFLAAFPYLSENAIVCLHDIRQNHKSPPDQEKIGTNVLFNSIAADKFINSDPTRLPDYPNIGAFRINPDTKKYITNVFGALTQSWSYFLPEKELDLYTRIISHYYPNEACWLYDHAVQMNRLSLSSKYNSGHTTD